MCIGSTNLNAKPSFFPCKRLRPGAKTHAHKQTKLPVKTGAEERTGMTSTFSFVDGEPNACKVLWEEEFTCFQSVSLLEDFL